MTPSQEQMIKASKEANEIVKPIVKEIMKLIDGTDFPAVGHDEHSMQAVRLMIAQAVSVEVVKTTNPNPLARIGLALSLGEQILQGVVL